MDVRPYWNNLIKHCAAKNIVNKFVFGWIQHINKKNVNNKHEREIQSGY